MERDDLAQWRDSLRALMRDPAAFDRYRDRRALFATRISNALVAMEERGPALYGVWLEGWAAPVYIGQTAKASRRLWDLAIGESHHLATTVPPEIWERVVVVPWRALVPHWEIDEVALRHAAVNAGVPEDQWERAAGEALERALQMRYRPVANSHRRQRDGTWRERRLEVSQSRGARLARQLGALEDRVLAAWEGLSATAPSAEGVRRLPGVGTVVFPGRFWDDSPLGAPRPRRGEL